MSCKSAIYVANTSPVTINLTAQQPTATMPLGTTVRRFGRANCENILELSGNGMRNFRNFRNRILFCNT